MKIAVIGKGGLVGSAIMRAWNALPMAGKIDPPDELIGFDIPEFDASSRIITDGLVSIRPDVILNLASVNLPDWLEPHPNTARTIHVQGTVNLRHAAQKTGALLVQLGCAEVFYTKTLGRAWHETDTPNPESIYAKTKLDAERAAAEYDRHLIVRTSALFGDPGVQGSGNLIDTLLKAVRRTRTIRVLDDMQVSLTFVDDLVGAIRALVRAGATGLYHVAAPEQVTPIEAAEFLLSRCGLNHHRLSGISTEEYGFRALRSRNTSLNSSRYHTILGTYPISGWRVAISRFLEVRIPQTAPLLPKRAS